MGSYSNIKYNGSLPDGAQFKDDVFQSKSLSAIGELIISTHGRLMSGDVDTNYHGVINFYKTDHLEKWREYWAKFTNGQLECILLDNPMNISVSEVR